MEEQEILINNFRLDGRKSYEIRDMNIKLEEVKNASGSCSIEAGGTKILVWVKGPRETKNKNIENNGILKCDFSISTSAYTHIKSEIKRDLQMREFSSTLKEIFEQVIILKNYPRSEIEINVTVLQNDGSFKTLSITAITIALINAGIYVKDTAVGVSLGYYNKCFDNRENRRGGSGVNKDDDNFVSSVDNIMGNNDIYLSDLTKDEERCKFPILNMCYLPNIKKFVFLEVTNRTIDFSLSEDFIKASENLASVVYNNVKSFLVTSFNSQRVLNKHYGGEKNMSNIGGNDQNDDVEMS